MLQAWGLAHCSSENGRQPGIFHEACAARLASNPSGTQCDRCGGDAMRALMVTSKIKAGHRDAFMEAMRSDARGSVYDEPGCLRFDVLHDTKDPHTIYLYEVYRDETAIEAHRQAPHFVKGEKRSQRGAYLSSQNLLQSASTSMWWPDAWWPKILSWTRPCRLYPISDDVLLYTTALRR